RAVREPSRVDHDLYSPATPPFRIAGGQKVEAEKVAAYELGYREEIDPRFTLSLSGFFNDYTDLRSLEPLAPPQAFPVEASNGLRGTSAGAELTAEWQVTANWRLKAGWTELRVDSEPASGSADRATRDSIVRDPNRQAVLRSFLDLRRGWELDGDVRYVSPITEQLVPGYAEGDLRLGWSPAPAWELSL